MSRLGGLMHYYEDVRTGSIYTTTELLALARDRGVSPATLRVWLQALPDSTCVLLEEAEAIAAERDQRRSWFGRWI